MAITDTWHITKSKRSCCRCGTEFREGQSLFSGLREEGADLLRLDICSGCWVPSDAGTFFCHWRNRRPATGRKPPVNAELTLEFFDRLESLQTEKKAVFRYVLALYLARRREFKLLEVRRAESGEKLIFQRRRTGGTIQVESPGLTEDQIQETEGQLSRLLDACL
jgi:hypothetical protein